MDNAALVIQARRGCRKSLELLIKNVVSEPDDGKSHYTKLELYAFRWSKSLKDMDVDDIINQMRICVWTAVENRNGWQPSYKVKFSVFCWILLKRDLAGQYRKERAIKRGPGVVHVGIEALISSPTTIRIKKDYTEVEGEELFAIDRIKKGLDPDSRLIFDLLLQGHTMMEIARIMSTNHNVWTSEKVKKKVKDRIASDAFKNCLMEKVHEAEIAL